MSTLAIARQRVATRFREILRIDGMSHSDAARWASCRDMADLGEMVVAWLNGEVAQNPGHCGPPCAETIPLIPVLTAVNRAGFVTDNSQRADSSGDRTWNAWVSGWADDATLARIRAATTGAGLSAAACRRTSHRVRPDAVVLVLPVARQRVLLVGPLPGHGERLQRLVVRERRGSGTGTQRPALARA